MAVLDLLGRRWALRIGWELQGRTLSFRELQRRCDGMSASVLAERLAELREAGIIELDRGGYRLTPGGEELADTLAQLDAWAKRWAKRQRARSAGTPARNAAEAEPRVQVAGTQRQARRPAGRQRAARAAPGSDRRSR
jgi:DNA-binding HxlR family transcriptional regulator